MTKKEKTQQPEDNQTDSRNVETTKRIHEHLANKKDIISIEDIKKAKTNLGDKTKEDKKKDE